VAQLVEALHYKPEFRGSIPGGVIFTVALVSTQLLTEMSIIETSSGGRGGSGQCVGLTTLSPSCADCLKILGISTHWSPKGLSRPV
jgi:hypothetical protein